MEPIRILHENVIMDPGGIETQLMRIYRNIDRSKIQFDFLLHRTQKGAFDDEIKSMGGRIYYAKPFNPFHHISYINSMKKFFSEHDEYKIMIAHAELALCPLKVAAEAGIQWRICYSHNGGSSFGLKRILMDYEKIFIKKYCTEMFAVSELAARYTFGDKPVDNGKVKLIKNGIMVDDFIFSKEIRNKKRVELCLDNKFIVGHVGRFMQQKNHMFLLETFAKLHNLRNDAHLILIGEGRLEDKILRKINELNIDENVTILGRRSDVNELMQAMDVFLFPSLWEGFPNVAIEAQASALPVYMSESITQEANFSQYSHRISLEKGAAYWAEEIYKNEKEPLDRIDMSGTMREQGYDVVKTAKWYENYYIEKMKELGY